jgi:hypothetical protein
LIPLAVARLLCGRAVVPQPIGLDDQAELRPVEVHSESIHPLLRQRSGQAGPGDQPEEAALEFRVGEGERSPVEQLAKSRNSGTSAMVFDGCPERFGIDQAEPVRLVDGSLKEGPAHPRAEVDQGASRRCDWDAIAGSSVSR